MWPTFAILMLLASAIPAALFLANLRAYTAPPAPTENPANVAVLIPARNEEANIAAVLATVLASTHTTLEILILDDHSTDSTAAIVTQIAAEHSQIHLLQSAPLPPGWNGKQHACWQLAQAATAPLLLFLDADVRLEPLAIARMAAFHRASRAALVSGFPRLVTIGPLEWLLLPLIHFVLLGFLPIARMRASTDASLAAGCGQFMLAGRAAYFTSGGHQAIRSTMHDGLLLPRTFRRAGFATDLADITTLAHVRMYDSAAKTWQGLAKNATEGLAAPARIVPLTLLLILGQILPILTGILCGVILISVHMVGATYDHPMKIAFFDLAVALSVIASFLPRILAARRFQQPLKSALFHPLGIALLLCVQWYALIRQLIGKPVGWRNRAYIPTSGTELKP